MRHVLSDFKMFNTVKKYLPPSWFLLFVTLTCFRSSLVYLCQDSMSVMPMSYLESSSSYTSPLPRTPVRPTNMATKNYNIQTFSRSHWPDYWSHTSGLKHNHHHSHSIKKLSVLTHCKVYALSFVPVYTKLFDCVSYVTCSCVIVSWCSWCTGTWCLLLVSFNDNYLPLFNFFICLIL